jgi:Na+-driven multidrug efflux pump
VRLPLALLLTRPFGLIGAWIAMGVDLNLRGLGMWLRFRSDPSAGSGQALDADQGVGNGSQSDGTP